MSAASQSTPDVGYNGSVSSDKPIEFLDQARRRYQAGLDADQKDREASELDNKFANATDEDKQQWDPIPLKSRVSANRPVMQWNRIPTYIQQVVNDGRANKPSIQVRQGVNGKKETAEFFQNRIRAIEYDCNADIAYDTSRDQQVTSGRGFIRVWCDYIPGTFKQRLCIDRIDNQYSVVYDPASMKYDRSDAEWCFVVSRISKEEHIRRYGKESVISRLDFATMGENNPAPGWIAVGDSNELIQIAEYWVREYRKDTLLLLTDSELPVWKSDLTPEQYKTFEKKGSIRRTREDSKCKVCRYIINGAEILEKGDWLGSTIPIVPVWGREAVVDGVRRTYSLIRMAKGPQKLVNLYVSNIAELIAMMPKAPYEAPNGSIAENHLNAWRDAGFDPKAILFYNQYDPDTNAPLNRPERVVNEPPIQAVTIALQQAIEGIKAAMGIYDASMGARSNETTGIAIERRKKQAEIVNLHFSDNEARSRKRIGEILIEVIPQIDKPGDTVPIRHVDGKTELVPIGKPYRHPKTGETVTHNLTSGDYGLAVSTGPTYDSQRAEIYERDLALIQADPTLMYVFGDQMLAADDAPGAEERAERMRRKIEQVNPGLIRNPDDKIPPQAQQALQQMQEKLQTVEEFAQEQFKVANDKEKDRELERWKVTEQEKTKRLIGLEKVAAEDARTELERSLEVTHKKSDQAHERDILAMEHQHEADQSQVTQAHESDEAQVERDHSAGRAQAERQHSAERSDADRKAARPKEKK